MTRQHHSISSGINKLDISATSTAESRRRHPRDQLRGTASKLPAILAFGKTSTENALWQQVLAEIICRVLEDNRI